MGAPFVNAGWIAAKARKTSAVESATPGFTRRTGSEGRPSRASIRSPIPLTIAGRGSRKNGTSAPSSRASSASRDPSSASGKRSQRARNTAPASLEPPPNPAPAGRRFSIRSSIRQFRPASSAKAFAARQPRLVASAGIASLIPSSLISTSRAVDSETATSTSSPRSSGANRLTSSWYPSARLPTTRRPRLILPGAWQRRLRPAWVRAACSLAGLDESHVQLVEDALQELGFGVREIAAGFLGEHFEGVDGLAGDRKIGLDGPLRSAFGASDLAELIECAGSEGKYERRKVDGCPPTALRSALRNRSS